MTLHRFFLDLDCFQGETVRFPSDRSHQISKVLRLKRGDRVVALDGSGAETIVRLELVGPQVEGVIEERRQNQNDARSSVVLHQAMLKGSNFELVLQKCTELGVSVFGPMLTERSVATQPSAARQERFKTIVREAAEQSGRGQVPPFIPLKPYPEAIARAGLDTPLMFLYEGEGGVPLSEAPLSEDSMGLFVGPEGGFTDSELQLAVEEGAEIVTLGPRTLRAETAAIAASAILLARLGELG